MADTRIQILRNAVKTMVRFHCKVCHKTTEVEVELNDALNENKLGPLIKEYGLGHTCEKETVH